MLQVISLASVTTKVERMNSPGNLHHLNPRKFQMGAVSIRAYLYMNSEKVSCHNNDSVGLSPYHVILTMSNFLSLGKENKHLLFFFHSSYHCSIGLVNVFTSNNLWDCVAFYISFELKIIFLLSWCKWEFCFCVN